MSAPANYELLAQQLRTVRAQIDVLQQHESSLRQAVERMSAEERLTAFARQEAYVVYHVYGKHYRTREAAELAKKKADDAPRVDFGWAVRNEVGPHEVEIKMCTRDQLSRLLPGITD